jgi:hypothetical protein
MSDRSSGEKFSRRKERAVQSLLTQSTLTEAARASGVCERTLRRWLQNEEFAERVRRERSASLESTVNLLRKSSGSAVEALQAVAGNKRSPAGARVSASRAILEFHYRGAELTDLMQRVAALEKQKEHRQ